MVTSLRWSFYLPQWKPTCAEWVYACQCIQKEECERISHYVFKRDAIASMVGRLLLRKAALEVLGLPYTEIILSRSDKDRPTLHSQLLGSLLNYDCNISHQGDYCVLAAETNSKVGVDVMEMEYRGGKSPADFFAVMNKKFTVKEWNFIGLPGLESDQLKRFFRLWTLKESYVKALGIGLGFDLQRLSFHCVSPTLTTKCVRTDTELYIDNDLSNEWKFQETLLDERHCAAVCLNSNQVYSSVPLFQGLTFQELIQNAKPLRPPDHSLGEKFIKKPESTHH